MNYTPDIPKYASFTWFQLCWYFDNITCNKQIFCWFGPANQAGKSFCSYIILANGNFAARSSIVPILTNELNGNDLHKQNVNIYGFPPGED